LKESVIMKNVTGCMSVIILILQFAGCTSADKGPQIVPVGKGWAKNSINATIFRRNSVTTHRDSQYVSFYSEDGHVVLAKRRLGATHWQIKKTKHTGDTTDAHNSISIAVDGGGVLHVSWDHHCDPLRYCRGKAPGSLELGDRIPMTGRYEEKVTYPEFYNLPDGDLLFVYRDGHSGRGNLMMNRYDVQTRKWSAVGHNLIDGQQQRNAYWNGVAIDRQGCWHISWCWRESGDVATNHDMCYARSPDGGKTWYKSTGEKYQLPITAENAEYACRIPQKSELINQTSMTVDSTGRPLIATFWRRQGTDVPQYQLIYHDGAKWDSRQVGRRKEAFRLSGGGTKYLPMSRPQVAAGDDGRVYVIFRDKERGNCVSAAVSEEAALGRWRVLELTGESLGEWEPSYDPVLWNRENVLHLFVQKVVQRDRDRLEDEAPQMVSILQWKP